MLLHVISLLFQQESPRGRFYLLFGRTLYKFHRAVEPRSSEQVEKQRSSCNEQIGMYLRLFLSVRTENFGASRAKRLFLDSSKLAARLHVAIIAKQRAPVRETATAERSRHDG